MVPIKIRKRDGNVVDFSKQKITIAMKKAAESVALQNQIISFDVLSDHVIRHIELKYKGGMPEVEGVQDLVEQTLMEYGLFEVAKAYILYRAEHSNIRDEKKQNVEEKISRKELHFIKNDGTRGMIDRALLRDRFWNASRGFKNQIDFNKLVDECERNLFDGMSLDELGTALVMTVRPYIERDHIYSFITARLGLQNLYQEVFGETSQDNFELVYRKSFLSQIKASVEDKRLAREILNFNLENLANYIKPERDDLFEYMGFQVLYDRYFLQEEGGTKKLETPQAFWMRVAMGLAMNEKDKKEEKAKEFYDVMSNLLYVPSTPTLFHAGTTFPQLSSCFLNTVEDDLKHIFSVYGDNAQMSKYSGGIGTDWTNIRGTGALIKTTNVGSQGVVPFLKIANDVTVAINRSGKRRGATVAYLESWHYDIEEFLDLRKNTGDDRRRTHDMNTANWIPDLFMKRIMEDGRWTLFSSEEVPDLHHIYGIDFEEKYIEYEKKADNGEIKLFKVIKAKDLWRKMITMLFETGHPWITFKDPCNIRSPQDHVGVIHNSNLCTEITLNNSAEETAVCNLGSINFSRHMNNSELDYKLLKSTVHTAMRMLDNVIDLTYYPTEQNKVSNMRHRPVGLGIMGFQDALYMQDINFASDEAVKFADQSMEFVSYHAILGSSMLAKERGAYETYRGSKWDRGIFPLDTLDLLEEERGIPIGVDRVSRMDWSEVRQHVKTNGIRNSNCMATAPTATISNISGCYPCIEPIYKNLYVKSNMSGEFTVVNRYLVDDLKRLGLWNETMLDELKRTDGEVADMVTVPPKLREKYKTVFEVGAHWLIKIAAYRGKWIDQSQSLNIFFKGTSGKQISDVYMLAWLMGLKTTYYLRTLGATSVEKSTINLNSVSLNSTVTSVLETMSTTVFPSADKIVKEESFKSVEVSSVKANDGYVMTSDGQMVKACRIDDPDCEACQ